MSRGTEVLVQTTQLQLKRNLGTYTPVEKSHSQDYASCRLSTTKGGWLWRGEAFSLLPIFQFSTNAPFCRTQLAASLQSHLGNRVMQCAVFYTTPHTHPQARQLEMELFYKSDNEQQNKNSTPLSQLISFPLRQPWWTCYIGLSSTF